MNKKKIALISAAAAVLLAVAGVCAAKFYVFATWDGPDQRIYLPADCDVRSALTSQLGPSYGSKVYSLWKRLPGSGKRAHGSFVVSDGDKALSVARSIAHGHQVPVRLTFNNIRTPGDMISRISAQLETDSASLAAACDSLLPGMGYSRDQYTAAFIPDTYEFYWTASAPSVVARLVGERDKYWNDDRLAKASAAGLTPAEVHTLASIVASESNKSDEWGKIARLYLNRLAKGMALQADPTVVFALGDFSIRRVTGQHLKVESPYNTYIHRGLPPGPIRMAERAQLDAVLDAPVHDYLYMCAKPDFSGYHNFAKDYNRHRINAARYYSGLKEKGL